ncbi:MAG: tRNA lysidine(34) synthetase TilS [Verrucomicrobia bacterium]|nr:tRNA lysidine(34) synthetase TilS [Verrucomicrobiota bacterium]
MAADVMLEQVRQVILERWLLARGEAVLVGVSGGPDSVALLDALAALAPEFGWRLRVAHFNHHLRGRASDADERFVRGLAEDYGLPVSVGGGDVRAFAAKQKLSIEDAARRMRHGFFAEVAATCGIRKLALGHTADDQVETLLQRLLRGAGTHGLAAMHWSNRLGELTVVRPMLGVWKAEALDYLKQRGLKFRRDHTNRDTTFQRNRIRHKLLPLLEREFNPAVKAVLHQTAEMLAAEDEWLEAQAVQKGRRRKAELPVKLLQRKHVAVQRRMIYRWLLANDAGAAVDFQTVEALRRMAGQGKPRCVTLTASVEAVRQADRLELRKSEVRSRKPEDGGVPPEWRLDVPGKTEVAALGVVVEVAVAAGKLIPKLATLAIPRSGEVWLDADAVGDALTVRTWRAGDRFQPIGMQAEKKLQDIFTDEKVPAAQRRQTPVFVAADGGICWVAGYRIGERFKLTGATRRALRVRVRPRLD